MMKRKLIFSLLIAVLIFPLHGCGQEKFPTDDQLIYSLTTHRQAYQKVVDVFLDKGLYRFEIMSDGSLNFRPEVKIDTMLLEKLIQKEISTDLVGANFKKDTYDTINEILFFNYRRGMVFAGEHKGIVYVVDESSEEPIVDQLDIIDRNDASIHKKRLYKKIEPHWYIFYEYFP